MTSRIGSPDTQADIEVRACLDQNPPQSFVMVAGAGSGKTTSLIKALAHLGRTRGASLRRAGQQIACITYTEVAAGEISADVGKSSLFHISTIHSFLWSVVRPFQSDIAAWVRNRIAERISEKEEHHSRPRTQEQTKIRLAKEIAVLRDVLDKVGSIDHFTYGTGSSYADGILGHDDVLKLAPACVDNYPLLRQIIASRFPYIFVDESQDTSPAVVQALRSIAQEHSRFCVGFFGDPMQKIYMGGAGAVLPGDGWKEITKPENFRCPTAVLEVINRIRASGDGLQQTRGRTTTAGGAEQPVIGTANLFVLPADEHRTERLAAVRKWLSAATGDDLWASDHPGADIRLLVLVHRMAATRLGFANIYTALHDGAPASLSDGLQDGTAWPVRVLVQEVLPLVDAWQSGDHFTIVSMLRASSPRLEPATLRSTAVAPVLAELREAVAKLAELLAEGSGATLRNVLQHVQDTHLLRLDKRFDQHLLSEAVDDGHEGFANVQALLACDVAEIFAYRRYIREESPFATQHGIKGAQFDRVLVILDDEEGTHSLYSYGKYFGYLQKSQSDTRNIAEGKESVVERTRRLFYVCCSRAVKDLAVVLFVPDTAAALTAVREANLFQDNSVRDVDDLALALALTR